MIKKCLLVLLVAVLLPAISYLYLRYDNNRPGDAVDSTSITQSLERSTLWVLNNREKVLQANNNAMLWWMIKRSAELTNDHRLLMLYREYRKKAIDGNINSVWRPLFIPYARANFSPDQLLHYPDYNQYFIYGLTCDKALGQTEIIQQQMSSDFCPQHHPISPACVTHQLMGLRFRQERGCGDPALLSQQVDELQEMIVGQLNRDPRVVDVYIQRVLMLVDTGAADRVNNKWLHNILDEQLADGGWANFQPLIPVFDSQFIGFNARGIAVRQPKANFHATAQGILLMSLLAQEVDKSND